ncbi:monofunctional biosynthetic peptidoglycan transglycosylase [Acinetobacter gerneri]|uniref:Biosynthetic peptidoglycan transglycosylase n=1 Tax=Acinetobacter gerneri TaxID=202952 RepID=A0AAW8JE27_9GAMM|nr:monofunctional biosynthetic peptidoglycan transglycosylase [Acinetobacter gerneri]MDQ9009824.1 monofunctional biosynthetic peptidoglycan transglycosylase [Acinetobacter gerneri]MDQ9013934.1 monofunctional biosynthetic peptidoglycan transglycosylase [Acinetobacter gerneri]MDQ9023611.1 monofunctional biosynthetic peptidoglycan transglycosylase [Acinetobacter gerneri]MDQ9052487.1 monofunctional biosynthetic peptidoglycan transglycosylase [Acinetobacter gerneri]MDQ9060004.1 monofunctional biosy
MKAIFVRILLILFSLFLLVQIWIFASLAWWRSNPVETTMLMRVTYWSDQVPIQHQWRDYDEISDNFKHALIAAEDAKFVDHHGFDWNGIEDALHRNLKNDKVVAGGSTISQQLAKNLFLFNKRSFVRKGQEAIATAMMERMWSKERILEVYMNSVEFGDHLFGIEAASQYYFGKSSKSLTRSQAAFLAAILPDPKFYQDHRNNHKLQYRMRLIMKYMRSTRIPD